MTSGDKGLKTRARFPGATDPIADLNPEDIESMTVLTGAAAAALYGSAAANGAIVITTRKGQEGKTSVTVSSNTEIFTPFVLPRFQNRYGTGDYNSSEGSVTRSWGSRLNSSNFMGYDPAKDYFRLGVTGTESVSLSTGNSKNQTYLSAAAVNSIGNVPNNKYNRYNFTFRNTTSFLDDKMTLDVSASFIMQDDLNMTNQGTYNNPLVGAYIFPRGNDWADIEMYERYDSSRKIYTQYWPVGDASMTIVKHEVGVMTSNDDNALFGAWGTDGNPVRVAVMYNMYSEGKHECITSGDSHAAADIICYMNGYNDPRRAFYFTRSEWAGYDYVGLRRGIVIPAAAIVHQYCGPVIETDDPACWMNAAEVAFLKAEAVAVFGFDMGTDARSAYEEGIRLSFEQYGASGYASYIADNTSVPSLYTDPAGSNSYSSVISEITIAWDEGATPEQKQERIITQKWIANWLLGNEAWADFRRTGYPRLIPATEAGNKSTDRTLTTTGARRIEYPDAEAVSNAENYHAAVSTLLGGSDNMSTRLWFDCKPDNPTYSR